MAENQKEQILEAASEKMRLAGIRSVSIDDICRELGMSKKTFYVYFETKDALVDALLRRREQAQEDEYLKSVKGKNVVDILVSAIQILKKPQDVRQIPPVLYDLKKYYPQAFAEHLARVKARNKELFQSFFEAGAREKVFREDMDPKLTAILFAKLHELMIEELTTAKDKNLCARVSKYGLDVLFRGIISEEGRRMIELKIED